MKAETTVNGPQASPKTASASTRQAATSRKRDEGGIAPRKSASRGYNDGVGGWKWEMSDYRNVINDEKRFEELGRFLEEFTLAAVKANLRRGEKERQP